MKQTIYILILLFSAHHGLPELEDMMPIVSDTLTTYYRASDTTELRESFQKEDLPASDYLTDKLKPIRENFKRINSLTNWSAIDSGELWDSSEGGTAKYYYQNSRLEKIVARRYGEGFQLLTEYYLRNGQLSFVFEKRYQYNRPYYYDTEAMERNNDTEAFDFEKSTIIEDRSYFENGILIHQINNQDCGAPFANDYLHEEQKRLKDEFKLLLKRKKSNDYRVKN